MKIAMLQESNDLLERSKKHKKNNSGSAHFTLNTDAGDVEHNVAMFNKMNSPAGGPSVNPCGPMAEELMVDVNSCDKRLSEEKMKNYVHLEYPNLEVELVTRSRRYSSYNFDYDTDDTQTAIEHIRYEHLVPEEEVVDFLVDLLYDTDDGTDFDPVAYVKDHIDELIDQYQEEILDYWEQDAREAAQNSHFDSLQCERFVRKLRGCLKESLSERVLDKNTTKELLRLKSLYEKYERVHDESHMSRIVEKVKSAVASCAMKVRPLKESTQYIIMAVCKDGEKKYYNSSNRKWVACGKDATLFDNKDAANDVWFKLDKKPFKRVFIPNYDYETMNEALAAVDVDRQYALDNLQDSIDDLMDWGLRGYKTRYVGNHVYRVEHRTGNTSVLVKFDVKDPSKKFVFLIDKQGPYTATTEKDAAKLIIDAVNNKHSKSFDMFGEDLSDRIRKNDLEFDDSIDAWHAEENGTEIQLQDRESHTHEFRTAENQWGRSYVAGQYNKQPKVASRTWGRVWKDGDLVKQFEGPKYQVRADMAKYLDADGKLDEAKIPDNWTQYNGAWMYPVSDGWEANLDGLHYEAETEDELKVKIDRAISGGWTKNKKLKQYFKEGTIRYQVIVDAVTPNYVVSEHEFLRDAIDAAREEIDLNWASNVRIKDLSDGACWHDIENAEADLRDGIVVEAWNPELVDCPVCGDISFDSRKGRCTQCSYREGLDEFSDELDHPDQEFDSAKTSINSSKLPAVYRMVKIPKSTVGVDFSGGSFDNAVEHIRDLGATLCVYDPYNRSAEHNSEVLKTLKSNGGADWAINSNVLNVIKEPEARKAVLKNISRITKSGAPVYITVYEGRGDGQEGATKSGYQLNRKTQDYLAEIQEVFPDAVRKGKLIVAHNGRGHVNESNNAYSYKDCTIIDVGSGWKVKDASQEWVGNEFATDRDAEEFVDSLNESFLDSDDNYAYVASKSVLDSDGFYTDYTWYKNLDGVNVFVFGDNDIYKPADGYIDHEEENDAAAQEWFDSYNGFEEDILDEATAVAERPLSNLQGTLSSALLTHKEEVDTLFDKKSAVEFLDRIAPEVKDKAYLAKVKQEIMRSRNPMQYLYNIILKGDGDGTEKGGKVTKQAKIRKWAKESVTESIVYPNGEPVTDIDLNKALDYMYGTDRNPEWTYTDAEMQRAVYRWMDKMDPRPDGKSYMSLQEAYNIKFFQIFEAPKKPTENGKMIGQRDSLSAAIDFGEDCCGKGNFFIKGVCDDGRTRYVDFYRKARGYAPRAEYKDDVKESFEADGPAYVASSIDSLNNYCAGLGDACKKLRDGNMCSYRGYEVEFVDGEYNVYLLESIDESKENRPLYIIKDSHGNQLSAPNPDDEELWDRVASMEARGRRGLCVVAYTGKKESLKEWNEFSDDDVEDDLTHAAVYGGDSKYCKECGAVKRYDEDGFAFCPKCDGLSESYWHNDSTLRAKQDELINQLEADGFQETDGRSQGSKHWTFFRKMIHGKSVWKAIFTDTASGEASIIDVTYGQVRGYEPLDSIDALRKDLGKALLPN